MRKLGFSEIWIRVIMTSVTSVSYFVLVNVSPGEKIELGKDKYYLLTIFLCVLRI